MVPALFNYYVISLILSVDFWRDIIANREFAIGNQGCSGYAIPAAFAIANIRTSRSDGLPGAGAE
jgi:hypothetical protein